MCLQTWLTPYVAWFPIARLPTWLRMLIDRLSTILVSDRGTLFWFLDWFVLAFIAFIVVGRHAGGSRAGAIAFLAVFAVAWSLVHLIRFAAASRRGN